MVLYAYRHQEGRNGIVYVTDMSIKFKIGDYLKNSESGKPLHEQLGITDKRRIALIFYLFSVSLSIEEVIALFKLAIEGNKGNDVAVDAVLKSYSTEEIDKIITQLQVHSKLAADYAIKYPDLLPKPLNYDDIAKIFDININSKEKIAELLYIFYMLGYGKGMGVSLKYILDNPL